MSEYMQEGEGAATPPPAFARYDIQVPWRDENMREVPHVLAAIRKALDEAGFKGRTVTRADGDWQGDGSYYKTDELAIVSVDAPDNPETEEAITTALQDVKVTNLLPDLYMRITPIRFKLV